MKILQSILLASLYLISVGGKLLVSTEICRSNTDCGWNSYCDHGQCWCKSGYQRQTGSSHCLDVTCDVKDCVQCLDKKFCKRCVGYLLTGTGQCIAECNTKYTLLVEGDETGRVCQANPEGFSMVYVSIIIAVCAAVLVVVLTVLAVHYKIRTHKERDLRLKLLAELLKKEKQNGIIKDAKLVGKLDDYSNASVMEDSRLQQLHYYHQVSALAPHIDTFVEMLRDAKLKCHSLGPNDGRQLLYRNLVHQLCRVVTVISDSMAPMPSDGNLLLDWARQMLTEYKRSQITSNHTGSWTLSSISPARLNAINRSLISGHLSHQSVSTPRSASNHCMEANRELGEITAIHLTTDISEPVEV